jgi:hypothetical protein
MGIHRHSLGDNMGMLRGMRMSKTHCFRLVFLFLAIVPCTQLFAQEPPSCPPSGAFIAPKDAAYEDAMALKKSLESQGMMVRCIFETKFSSQFLRWDNGAPRSTIEGEACIRTNLGDLSVLFMPKPSTFAALKIKERRSGGRYLYTFSGMSDVWPRTFKSWSSARRDYFFRHDNYLLSGAGDELRSAVEAALHQAPLSL